MFFLPFETFSPLLIFGLNQAVFYYKDKFASNKALIATAITIVVVINIVFQAIFLLSVGLVPGWADTLSFGYTSLLLYNVAASVNILLLSVFVLLRASHIALIISTGLNALFIALVYATGGFHLHMDAVLWGRVFILCFIVLLLLVFVFRYVRGERLALLNRQDLRMLLRFTGGIAGAAIIGGMVAQLPKLFVAKYYAADDYAVYVNGAFEIPLIAVITASVASATLQPMVDAYRTGNLHELKRLIARVAETSAAVLLPTFAFAMVLAPELIQLLFSSKYMESVIVFRLFLLLLPIRILAYGNVLLAIGKTGVLIRRAVIEGLIVLAFLWVFGIQLRWNMFGLALATVLPVLLWTVPFNLYTIQQQIGNFWSGYIRFGQLLILLVCSGAVAMVLKFLFFAGRGVPSLQLLLSHLLWCGALFGLVLLVFCYGFNLFNMRTRLKQYASKLL